ncbi:MAG: ATP-binding protein [Thermoplasmata archaeon]|jgi:hypothetical protein
MKILKDRIEKGKNNISYFELDLPARIKFSELSEILTEEPHSMRIDIKSISDNFSIKILESESQRIFPAINSKNFSSIIKNKNKLVSAKSLLEYIISGKGHLYDVNFIIYIKGKEYHNIINKYKSKKFKIKRYKFDIFNKHKKFIMPPDNSEGRKLHTHGISYLFPFPGNGIIMENGILIGFHYYNNMPIIFNRWEFPASHGIITGSTGYGKSHFVKMVMMREKLSYKNTKYFIIDPLGEYKNLSKFLDIKYSNLNDDDIPDVFTRFESESLDEYVERISSLFSSIFHLSEREKIYFSKSIKSCVNCNAQKILKSINSKDSIGKNLKSYISDFYDTQYGKFLFGNNKIPENGIIFDFSKIKEMDFYISIKIILNSIIPILKNDSRKFLVIDEAWKIMKDEELLNILDMMFRHVRRYKTSINLITQKSDDLLKNEKGKTMMHNSLIHVIFRHNEVSEDMENFYSLNKNEIKYIENLKGPGKDGSEAFMISQHIRIPIKIPLSQYEIELMGKNEIF